MELKRILATVLILCTVFVITACGHDPEELAWKGYKDKPFKEFLEIGLVNAYEESDDCEATVKVTVKEGWDTDELDEDDAEEPYTYIAECSIDGELEETFTFYMDVDGDYLVVKGGSEKEADGRIKDHDKESTEGFLDEIMEHM